MTREITSVRSGIIESVFALLGVEQTPLGEDAVLNAPAMLWWLSWMADARPVAGSRSQVLTLVVTLVIPKYGSVASPVVNRPVLAPQPMLSGMVATRKN